jgi:hypothetical protein
VIRYPLFLPSDETNTEEHRELPQVEDLCTFHSLQFQQRQEIVFDQGHYRTQRIRALMVTLLGLDDLSYIFRLENNKIIVSDGTTLRMPIWIRIQPIPILR